jgi:hypothetical protein
MPSKVTILTLLAALFLLASTGVAQNYNYYELGVMSGSGVAFMPTSSNAPAAQFRLEVARIGLAKNSGQGVNLYSLGAGLSQFLEAYVKVTSEQTGTVQSMNITGVGGKFTIPVVFPVVKIVSLWGESSVTQTDDFSQLYPANITRGAVIVTPFVNGLRPSLLLGATKRGDESLAPMVGGSLVVPASHDVQIGAEYLEGYTGKHSHHTMLIANVRAFSNISLHGGPGYCSTPSVTGLLWTFGVSLNTSDIDFQPVRTVAQKQEYKLPSIEDLEKEPPDNKGNSSEGKEE